MILNLALHEYFWSLHFVECSFSLKFGLHLSLLFLQCCIPIGKQRASLTQSVKIQCKSWVYFKKTLIACQIFREIFRCWTLVKSADASNYRRYGIHTWRSAGGETQISNWNKIPPNILISIKFKPRGSWFLYECKEIKINQNLVCVWSTSLTNAGEAEEFCPSHRSDCQAVCWSFQHHSIHADTFPICLTLKHIYLLAMLIVELRPVVQNLGEDVRRITNQVVYIMLNGSCGLGQMIISKW